MPKAKAKKQYSADVKAAVISAILAGMSATEAEAQYGVSRRTASRWVTDHGGKMPSPAQQKEKETETVQELVLDYLTESLRTLRHQVRFFKSDDWLAEQDADKVAILHGVIADKGSRIVDTLIKMERERQRLTDGTDAE